MSIARGMTGIAVALLATIAPVVATDAVLAPPPPPVASSVASSVVQHTLHAPPLGYRGRTSGDAAAIVRLPSLIQPAVHGETWYEPSTAAASEPGLHPAIVRSARVLRTNFVSQPPAPPVEPPEPELPPGGFVRLYSGWSCSIVGGVGLYYLQPNFGSDTAFIHPAGGDEDFDWSWNLAPRAWLGFSCSDGHGARVRFWTFDHDPGELVTTAAGAKTLGPFAIKAPNPGDKLKVKRDLELDVVDAEFTQVWCVPCWQIIGSAGARYVDLKQRQIAFAKNVNALGPRTVVLYDRETDNRFEGAGPTASLEIRRVLTRTCAAYGSVRGSAVIGESEQETLLLATGYIPCCPPTVVARTQAASETDILPILEAELGFECSVWYGPQRWFFQAAAVYQSWYGVGSAGNHPGLGTGSSDLEFFGATLTLGAGY